MFSGVSYLHFTVFILRSTSAPSSSLPSRSGSASPRRWFQVFQPSPLTSTALTSLPKPSLQTAIFSLSHFVPTSPVTLILAPHFIRPSLVPHTQLKFWGGPFKSRHTPAKHALIVAHLSTCSLNEPVLSRITKYLTLAFQSPTASPSPSPVAVHMSQPSTVVHVASATFSTSPISIFPCCPFAAIADVHQDVPSFPTSPVVSSPSHPSSSKSTTPSNASSIFIPPLPPQYSHLMNSLSSHSRPHHLFQLGRSLIFSVVPITALHMPATPISWM